MEQPDLKENAESLLRALPSVLGAFVQPDAFGRPREIHLLIEPGPRPRDFAEQVKATLESKLRIPIDQRIISIAQVAKAPPARSSAPADSAVAAHVVDRIQLDAVESDVSGARTRVIVKLTRGRMTVAGTATELEVEDGRARAAARATLDAVNRMAGEAARFSLDFATIVQTLGREYVLVAATVSSVRLGRRAVPVTGAQPLGEEIESAAALATLKAVNRLLEFAVERPTRAGRPRADRGER